MSRLEIGKDTIQELTESASVRIGNIATIITTATRDVVRETGDWLTDVLEMREAAARVHRDETPAPEEE